ncbi:MAG: DUF2723 domain-containing protein [Magnetococcales bacterium]|nr:DUF2723 domain-containing protein [Magnetococcales bacterium]
MIPPKTSTKSTSKNDDEPERFIYEPASFHEHKLTLLALFLGIFAFYLSTSPRFVALEDDGLYLLSNYFLGISHPSGYPLYNLIAHFLISIPGGSVAFKGHAISGFFGALTCLMVFWLALGLRINISSAIIATLMFAASKAFWSQAIITEVYTLNSLIFFLILHQILILGFAKKASNSDNSSDRNRVLALAFLYGLSLANHWPLMGMATPGLLLLLWPRWRLILKSIPLAIPISILAMAPPYIWMVIRSQQNPLVSFIGPINGWDEFLVFFLRKHFFFQENQIAANFWDKVTYAQGLGWEMIMQFSPVGFVLVVWGGLLALRRWPRQLNIGLITIFISTPLILLLKLNVAYSYTGAHVISVTPLLSYGICAIWLALGIMAMGEKLQHVKLNIIKPRQLRQLIAAILICLPVALHYETNGRQGYRWVNDYADFVFSLIENNAVFFVSGDLHLFGLGYLHYVEGIRPDITFIPTGGLVFSTRLFKPDRLSEIKRKKIIQDYIKSTDRPIYFIPSALDFVGKGYSNSNLGVIYRLNKNNNAGNVINIDEKLLDFLIKTKQSLNHSDNHTKEYSLYIIANIIRSFVGVSSTISPEHQKDVITRSLEMFGEPIEVKIAALHGIMDGEKGEDRELVEKILAECRTQLKQIKDRTLQSSFYFTQSGIYHRWNQMDKAIDNMRMSLDIRPDVFNPALKELIILLKKAGRHKEAHELRQDYINRSKEQWDMLRSMQDGSLYGGG